MLQICPHNPRIDVFHRLGLQSKTQKRATVAVREPFEVVLVVLVVDVTCQLLRI